MDKIEINEYKNPRKISEDGAIDVDINHPLFGWIPFTLILGDPGTNIDINKLHEKIVKENKL